MRSVYWQATRTVPRPPKPLGPVSQPLINQLMAFHYPRLLLLESPEVFDATGSRVMF